MVNIKNIRNVITSILVIVVVFLAIALVGVRLFGIQVYTVLSGSMEPTYPTGSLIYVKEIEPTKLKEGDVITFLLDEHTIATHRIVDVIFDDQTKELRFQTKGDANETVDGALVDSNNVIGTPVFKIPKMGYVIDYVQHPPGLYIAIAIGLILLALAFLPDILKDEETTV